MLTNEGKLSPTRLDESEHEANDAVAEESSETISKSSSLLAWSSQKNNNISIIELETTQTYANFDGVEIKTGDWTHVKEIPNSKLLVSLNHHLIHSANMAIFDVSKKGKTRKIYAFEEAFGATGVGDVTFNTRRDILGAIPVSGETAYHLWNIGYSERKGGYHVKLLRKSKWHPRGNSTKSFICGFDFNPTGELSASIDQFGDCLISDVNTNCKLFSRRGGDIDPFSRCRWSTNAEEPLLFVKYRSVTLNVLDVEKEVMALKMPADLESYGGTFWIDVCQSNSNLLATGGNRDVKIFDKREARIVKTFHDVHSSTVHCVRWNPSGDLLATASNDRTAQVLDFGTEKVLCTETTLDGSQ